jgi:hypothetical protein
MARLTLLALTLLVLSAGVQAKDTNRIFISNEQSHTLTVLDGSSWKAARRSSIGSPGSIRSRKPSS